MSVLNESVLVLNRSWRPISTTTVRSAVSLIFQGTARVVDPASFQTFDFETWREAAVFARQCETRVVRGIDWQVSTPEVVVLQSYNGVRRKGLAVTRRNVFARDGRRCQYCGRTRPGDELSLDHVIPRSRGGGATWENLVVACLECNQRKAARTPKEAGMALIREPEKPATYAEPYLPVGTRPPESWESFLSRMYWETELQ